MLLVSNWITLINKKRALARYEIICKKYNINLDPRVMVKRLSVGQRQMVEIIKVLWESKDIIVFDEPTATLSVREIKDLEKALEFTDEIDLKEAQVNADRSRNQGSQFDEI